MLIKPSVSGKIITNTISFNADPAGSIIGAGNGLIRDGSLVKLGGTPLTESTNIKTGNNPFFIEGALNSGIKPIKWANNGGGVHLLKVEDAGAYCHNIYAAKQNEQNNFTLPVGTDPGYGMLFHFYNGVSNGLVIQATFPMSIYSDQTHIWTNEIGATATIISVDNRYWTIFSWTGKWNFN